MKRGWPSLLLGVGCLRRHDDGVGRRPAGSAALRPASTRRPRRRPDRRRTRSNVPDATRPISGDRVMRRPLSGRTSSRNGDRER